MGALLDRWNLIRTRLQAHRLTNGVGGKQKTIETQTHARRRLHEIGRGSGGICRGQRDRRGVSTRIDAEKRRVDEMHGRRVYRLNLGRTDIASGEKNSDEDGNENDELGGSRQRRSRNQLSV